MFLTFFFTAGGTLTIVIAILHQSKGFIGTVMTMTLKDVDTAMKMILVGAVVALVTLVSK